MIWNELQAAHRRLRDEGRKQHADVNRRLHELAERGHCSRTLPHRFTRRGGQWFLSTPDGGRQGAEPLQKLAHGIGRATLRVLALESPRHELERLTIHVEGSATDGRPFVIAVHFTPEEGAGACGHALLHCHVGPDLDALPKVRVPLPALRAPDALDWVLASVLDGWEPAPWPEG